MSNRQERRLESLAVLGRTLDVHLPEHVLAEVADLTLRLHQESARNAGAILPSAMTRSYTERGESEQAGMRSAVVHVLAALVLLDLVELPGA